MFGQFYKVRDEEVAGRRGLPPVPRGGFARAVLADILNRSLALELAFRRVYESDPGFDRDEALGDLAGVVATFLQDIGEARTRGLRARLFAPTDIDTLTVDSVPDMDVEDLGGELVTVARAENED